MGGLATLDLVLESWRAWDLVLFTSTSQIMFDSISVRRGQAIQVSSSQDWGSKIFPKARKNVSDLNLGKNRKVCPAIFSAVYRTEQFHQATPDTIHTHKCKHARATKTARKDRGWRHNCPGQAGHVAICQQRGPLIKPLPIGKRWVMPLGSCSWHELQI